MNDSPIEPIPVEAYLVSAEVPVGMGSIWASALVYRLFFRSVGSLPGEWGGWHCLGHFCHDMPNCNHILSVVNQLAAAHVENKEETRRLKGG